MCKKLCWTVFPQDTCSSCVLSLFGSVPTPSVQPAGVSWSEACTTPAERQRYQHTGRFLCATLNLTTALCTSTASSSESPGLLKYLTPSSMYNMARRTSALRSKKKSGLAANVGTSYVPGQLALILWSQFPHLEMG